MERPGRSRDVRRDGVTARSRFVRKPALWAGTLVAALTMGALAVATGPAASAATTETVAVGSTLLDYQLVGSNSSVVVPLTVLG